MVKKMILDQYGNNVHNFQEKESKKIHTTELLSFKSPYYAESQLDPYNPDDLYQKKGSLDVYRKMLFDDQVKAVISIKINSILASDFSIIPASDDKQDIEIKDFIEYCLKQAIRPNFYKILRHILTAIVYGFSVSEKIFKRFDFGNYNGKIGIDTIKTKPPDTFEFHTDDFNNLKFLKQLSNKGDNNYGKTDLPYFIIFTYDSDNSSFGNYYGTSDLRAAYRSWWSKDIIIRFMNIYLERYGMGTMVAKYDKGISEQDKDAIDLMIKNLQAKTGFRVPKDVEIEILEANKNGEQGYISAIEKHNIMIARSVLIPDLLGFSDNKSGSYNLGENQFNLFMVMIENLRKEVEEVINDQIVKQLIDFNFSNISEFPKFAFNPIQQKDKEKLHDTFIKAVEKGVILPTEDDEQFLRESIDFPKREKEAVLLPQKQASPMPFSKEEKPEISVFQRNGFYRELTPYEQRIDFVKLDSDINKLENEESVSTAKIVKKIKDDLVSSIIRKKIIENKDVAEVNDLSLKFLSELKMQFKDIERQIFMKGRKDARQEVIKAKSEVRKFQVDPTILNLPPKEAIKYLENKAVWMTGVEKDFVLNNVKPLLLDGIKTGKSTAEVIFAIEEMFESKYALENIISTGITTARLETVVRTNFSDAYNQGRLTTFQDDDIKEIVPALQYSAILDDRTSDICNSLDGKIFKQGDPLIAKYTPPNHFNCRSIWTSIIKGESYEVSARESISKVQLPSGFGGMTTAPPRKVSPVAPLPETIKKPEKSPEEWLKSLTSEEKNVVGAWQGIGYERIREYQLTGAGADRMKGVTKTLTNALDKSSPYEGTVWRGLNNLGKNDFDKISNAKKFNWKAFSSSAKDEKSATRFLHSDKGKNSIMFRIKNKTGVDITPLVGNEEAEVILKPGKNYNVISKASKTFDTARGKVNALEIILEESQ